jgi:hypothetical protein
LFALFATRSVVVFHQSYRFINSSADFLPPSMLHRYGIAALIISGLSVIFYFWLYREIRRNERHDEQMPPYRKRR